jgi:polyphosphate kinase
MYSLTEKLNLPKQKTASIIIKVNSLSDAHLIQKLHEAALAGVEIKLIVRGIFCAKFEQKNTNILLKPLVLLMNIWSMLE